MVVSGDFNCNVLSDNGMSVEMSSLDLFHVIVFTYFVRFIFGNDLPKRLFYDQVSRPVFSKHDLIFLNFDINLKP